MVRILIVNAEEQSSVPFLRGILTRSLQNSGMGFEESYRIASDVRNELATRGEETVEVTADELRQIVTRHLEAADPEAMQRYNTSPQGEEVLVQFPNGPLVPYSRGRYALSLRAAGLSSEEASRIATLAHGTLVSRRVTRIHRVELRRLTHGLLCRKVDEEAAHRYLVWREFQASGRSLLILIGGIAGCGKSTVSSQLAHLLEIVRTQSTDMLREVMRMTMPEGLLPVLHKSSFRAGEAVRGAHRCSSEAAPNQLADGYLQQTELVSVACEAAVKRAASERVSLVLEGVHVHSSMVERVRGHTDSVVVPVMLASLKPALLRERIESRGVEAPGRRAGRYLSSFDSLWQLQSFLLDEADHAHIPIVPNEDLDSTVQQIILIILRELSRHFEGDPKKMLA